MRVSYVLLGLQDAFAHAALDAAASDLRCDEANRIDELLLRDAVQPRHVNVVEQLVDVFDARLDLHGLQRFDELLFVDARRRTALVATEDLKKPLQGKVVLVLYHGDLGASRGQDWIDKAALKEGDVYAASCHEVNEVLVGDLKLVLVGKTDILYDPLALCLRQSDLQAGEVSEHTGGGDILDRRHIGFLLSSGPLCSLLLEENVLKRHILLLEATFDLLVYFVDLLAQQYGDSLQVLWCSFHEIFRIWQLTLIGFIRLHCQTRDVAHVIDDNFSTISAVNNVEYLFEILLSESYANKLVHSGEVLESESADLLGVELCEHLVEWVAVAIHAGVELLNPVNEHHSLILLLLLHGFCALDDPLLEFLKANGGVSAFVRLNFGQSRDLVLGQASLETLQASNELGLAQATRARPGVLVTPLVE